MIHLAHNLSNHAGWAPVRSMAALAERLLGAEVLPLGSKKPSRLARLWHARSPRKTAQGPVLLAILQNPAEMQLLRAFAGFNGGYSKVAVWIIDSFQTGALHSSSNFSGIDLLATTQSYDRAFYSARHRGTLITLPWGSDVLGQSVAPSARGIDLQRLGRQPPEWDDDAATAAEARSLGLSFAGRPPFGDSPEQNQANVTHALRSAKYVLAFSNLAAPAAYTHAEKDYFTGRWADALACGASVAGIAPAQDRAFADLMWDEALLELPSIARTDGLQTIAAAARGWTPRVATINHMNALRRLDWRWRLKELARHLEVQTPALDAELAQLEARAAQLDAG